MADLSAVYDALRQANAAGDTTSVQKLSDYIRAQSSASEGQASPKIRQFDSNGQGGLVPTGSPQAAALRDPTSGMSGLDKFTAAAGKAPVDLARGTGQMLGMESRKDVADSRAQDAPLMSSAPAKWGNLAGAIGTMAPAMLVPGANTMAGAGAIGAASGLLAPSTSTGETLANTGIGAVAGPAGLLVGRGAVAAAKAAKAALIDPFTKSGQQGIAARAMQSFAGNPQEASAAASRLDSAPSVLPGVQPTTAELGNNAGLAQLERTLRNNPEYMQQFAARDQGNRGAMTSALQDIAGTPAQRAAAEAQRTAVSNPMYEAARNVTVPSDATLEGLLQRPSMQSAVGRAGKLAAERGEGPLAIPSAAPAAPGVNTSGGAIQYLKMGLNDLLDTGEQKGMGAHELGAVKTTAANLRQWINANHPPLAAADSAFDQLSQPINRMDVGQKLADSASPALNDFGTDKFNGSAFANTALRQGDRIASQVTGNPNSTLDSVLQPHELEALRQVGEQFARSSNAQNMGRAVGSNTGQNLVSQNVLSQFLGPLGLPQSTIGRAAGSTIYNTLGKLGGKTIYAAAEPDVLGLLTKAGLDPKMAAGLLRQSLGKPGAGAVPRLQSLTPLIQGARSANSTQQ